MARLDVNGRTVRHYAMKNKGTLLRTGVWVVALSGFGASSGCVCTKSSAGAYDDAYRVGEKIAKDRRDAYDREKAFFGGLKFEPYKYAAVSDMESTPSANPVCGVLYRLSEKEWGIVPGLLFDCDREPDKKAALDSAGARLRARLAVPADDLQARLEVRDWPLRTMGRLGDTVVRARVLDVPFDVDKCVGSVADRLAESVSDQEALRCEIFTAPGVRVKQFRDDLVAASNRVKATTPVARNVVPASKEEAAACSADEGIESFSVPGMGTANMAGRPLAYKIPLRQGEKIQIDMASRTFDAYLELKTADCRRSIARDDDGGGHGGDARIQWTVPETGDFMLLASGIRAGFGAFTLRVGFEDGQKGITEEQKKAMQVFSEWVDKATDEEVMAAWRGTVGADLQLGCLNSKRYSDAKVVRASVLTDAYKTCVGGLDTASAARFDIIRGRTDTAAQGTK